jgi:hypothetical protein
LREDVELTFLRQEFDGDAGPRLLPRLRGQVLLQLAQAAFGRADQVTHRRGAGAHFREHFLGRDAAIHQPGALGFAVLFFDFLEHPFERLAHVPATASPLRLLGRLIGGVAGEHFVAERKAFGGDD